MSKNSPAFELAQHIHDTVWQRNNLVPGAIFQQGRIHGARGHTTNTEQVVAFSKDPSDPAYETLTKTKNGRFYFHATVGPDFTGEMSMGRHVITPNSGEDLMFRLASSLLVRELAHIAIHLPESE